MRRIVALLLLPLALAAAPAWDAAPWLADLAQIRTAIDRDYPNRDWLVGERAVSLDRWFDSTAQAIREGGDDAGARRALDRLIERFADGHLELRWLSKAALRPDTNPPSAPTSVAAFCAARGYDAGQVTTGTAAALPGYRSIATAGPFATGIVPSGDTPVGVVRIGVFSPQGYPATCEQAVAATRTAIDRPCDERCEDRILTEAYARLTRGLIAAVESVQRSGARVLLIDLTRNGGGSEWAEAAARIVSPVPLRSAEIGLLPSRNWVGEWRDRAKTLRSTARTANRADRALLLDLARQADATADRLQPCDGATCARLVRAGYASGLVPEMPAGRLTGRAWAAEVFSAAQFPYRDAVWRGPVIVLVDSETWSAAEQFAAVLRDNDAAIVLGTRTGGAGCGHIGGSDPVVLTHSRAVLDLPNCARFRRDGSNEVGGIIPDVSIGVRANDGPAFAGRLTAAALPDAIAKATALRR